MSLRLFVCTVVGVVCAQSTSVSFSFTFFFRQNKILKQESITYNYNDLFMRVKEIIQKHCKTFYWMNNVLADLALRMFVIDRAH